MTAIYIESGDEITTVVERLKAAAEPQVALVVPKGATLLQSVVNLKLARKAAADAGKEIVIVSTDPVGKNLCAQLGIPVAATEEAGAALLAGGGPGGTDTDSGEEADPKVVAGIRIHRYYDDEDSDNGSSPQPEPIIIPKKLLQEETVAPEAPIVVPPAAAEPLTRTRLAEPPPEPATAASPPLAAPEASKAAKLKREPAKPLTKTQRRVVKLSLYLGGIGLLAVLAIAFLFLPMTTVALTVPGSDWSRELSFTGSTLATTPSPDLGTLPAEALVVTMEKTLPFTATGTKDVGEKASGTVTFYNYDSTSAVTVPSGTRVVAGGNIVFLTTAAVSVPGFTQAGGGQPRVPGTAKAPVQAELAGPDGNVNDASAADIRVNGVLLTDLSVTAGGGTTKQVTVVSATDIANAKNELATQLTAEARTKLAETLANRQVTFKEGADKVELGDLTSTVASNTEAAGGEVAGSVTLKRTVVNTQALEEAIQSRLRSVQDSGKSYAVTEQAIAVPTVAEDGTTLAIVVSVRGKEAPKIDSESLPLSLAGSSLSAGERTIAEKAPGATATVRQSPAWWPVKRYPTFNRYISVTVTYE